METAEDEWWVRMERAETIDYSVRASAPGASNPELTDTTSACPPRQVTSNITFASMITNTQKQLQLCLLQLL
ncbi:hypothetical protein CDAR_283681 [Caerostris darwini]|uniref:Uncharacterized protein n=1 Tax=Caerostris darwini TaxID=1538125 RepID=A0AAV4MEP2_9ARAC|nr:hypothetical protein CDAR_283681 [Caerostris darwini]